MEVSSVEKKKSNAVITAVARILFVIFALSALFIAFRSDNQVVKWPISEDAYYAYAVSNNIANGNGVTIDGTTLTNGFQPLYTFISVPVFMLAGGDKVLAVRYALILHWVFYMLTAVLLGSIALNAFRTINKGRNQAVFWLTAFVYMSSLLAFRSHFNGLETGFYLFMLALTWWYYQSRYDETLGRRIMLGVLLGLVVLARVDAVFLVIVVSAYLALKNLRSGGLKRAVGVSVVPFMAVLVSSPWWIYNVVYFGSLMPISGQSGLSWGFSIDRLYRAIAATAQAAVHPTYSGPKVLYFLDVIRIALIVAAVIFIIRSLRVNRESVHVKSAAPNPFTRTVEFGFCLVLTMLALFIWYVVSTWMSYFYMRYFTPVIVFSTIGIGYILFILAGKKPKLAVALVVVFTLTIAPRVILLYSPKYANHSALYYTQQLRLIEENVPAEDYVMGFGTGTLNYFRPRVVNLDGKVNCEAYRNRDCLEEYMKSLDIKWACDLPECFENFLGEGWQDRGWTEVASYSRFKLYRLEE